MNDAQQHAAHEDFMMKFKFQVEQPSPLCCSWLLIT